MRSNSPAPPGIGDVIRYAYLWSHENAAGREEGVKDRPCAVVLAVRRADGTDEVAVLPITSTRPADPRAAVEVPPATRTRLGLQREACWVVVSEFNLFAWPGPDLRPASPGAMTYGRLPAALLLRIREAFGAWRAQGGTRAVRRTE